MNLDIAKDPSKTPRTLRYETEGKCIGHQLQSIACYLGDLCDDLDKDGQWIFGWRARAFQHILEKLSSELLGDDTDDED